jgi:hypothetical protein
MEYTKRLMDLNGEVRLGSKSGIMNMAERNWDKCTPNEVNVSCTSTWGNSGPFRGGGETLNAYCVLFGAVLIHV